VADLVSDTNNELYVSLATVWELSNKAAAYRLPLAGSSVEDMVARFEELEPVFVSITRAEINRVATLPQHHGDPFDRMLIAQAQALSLTLLTKDGRSCFMT
jgi:PIN domain nuclease of toxin-antitoxin system